MQSYLNFHKCIILPLACSKIWLPKRRRIKALDWGCDKQEDWGQLHGQPEGWSYSVRVSCWRCVEYHCIWHLINMHLIIFLFLYRLINVLQPGSIKKINNPSQNWHQVMQADQKEHNSPATATVLYYISFIDPLLMIIYIIFICIYHNIHMWAHVYIIFIQL